MDERSAKLNKLRFARYIVVVLAIGFSHSALLAEYEYQWAQISEIQVNLHWPEDGTYVPINHTKTLYAVANDLDCVRYREVGTSQWSAWYTYYDVVQAGNTSSDYHMWWTVTKGELLDMYGTTAVWQAPGYSSGENVRDVLVTAFADDFNRGSDTLGYNDTNSGQDSITLKLWQVTVTTSQSGSKSENNDVANYPYYGDPTLGWITPNNPTGAAGYFGNTEVKGTIPPGVPNTSFGWRQTAYGYSRHSVQGTSGYTYDWQSGPEGTEDNPDSSFVDGSSYHNGEDVDEIFMMDAPGFPAGVNNNANLSSPWWWDEVVTDGTYKPYVELGGLRISNYGSFTVRFVLEGDFYMDGYTIVRFWKVDPVSPHVP